MHIVDGVEQPVVYASQRLSKVEYNYVQIEQEVLGIIFGVKQFNRYLNGCELNLATYHHPLCTLFGCTH